jgi:hypothetical protein
MQTRSTGRGARESADNYSASLIKCLGKFGKRCKDMRGCAAAAVAVVHCSGLVHAWPQRDVSPSPPHSITYLAD